MHGSDEVKMTAIDEVRDIERQRFEQFRRKDYSTEPVTVTRCARCSHTFTSRPADRQNFIDFTSEIAAHQERCFLVGDWVRWEWPSKSRWAEGTLRGYFERDGWTSYNMTLAAWSGDFGEAGTSKPLVVGEPHSFGVNGGSGTSIRRIPRPQQGPSRGDRVKVNYGWGSEFWGDVISAVSTTAIVRVTSVSENWVARVPCPWPGQERSAAVADMTVTCPAPHRGKPTGVSSTFPKSPAIETPAPVLYDGLDVVTCYRKWSDNRDCVERGGKPLYAMTGDQIAAGRRFYTLSTYHEHAKALRSKLAASAEAERNQVRVELQDDLEGEPW